MWAASISTEVLKDHRRAVLFPTFPLGRGLSLRKDMALLKPQSNNSLGRNRHRAPDTTYFCNKAEQKPPSCNLFSFEKQKALLKILNNFHTRGVGGTWLCVLWTQEKALVWKTMTVATRVSVITWTDTVWWPTLNGTQWQHGNRLGEDGV